MKSRMNRREFIRLVVAGGVGGTAAMALPRLAFPAAQSNRPHTISKTAAQRPNIIVILADDMGYSDLSCYGNQEGISTPNIDALAKGGMRFTDFHSNGPVCSPTRAALLTGRYQQRCGIEGVVLARKYRKTGMAPEEVTFAEVLKTAGYATAMFGKWHLGYRTKFNPTKQGFDVFDGFVSGNVDYQSHIDVIGRPDWWKNSELLPKEGYSTYLIEDYGLRFIEQHKDEPFCLYLAHESPHFPYQGPNDPADRTPGNPNPARGRRNADKEDRKLAYKEMIEAMDSGIGRTVAALKRLGIEQKTFIFFFSDNGPMGPGTCIPLNGRKGGVLEGGHRVPAIAYWPGKIKPGSVTDETAMGMDLFPTITAIAGATLPAGLKLDGVNLLGLLLDGKKLAERSLFWRYGERKAVRKGPWKLVVQSGVHLYNLDDDLAEKNDLAASEPEMVKALQAELAVWERDVDAGVKQRTPIMRRKSKKHS